jgi:hypothetical protein
MLQASLNKYKKIKLTSVNCCILLKQNGMKEDIDRNICELFIWQRLISKIYKELQKLNSKKQDT